MFEPNAEWTEQAKANIQASLEELQARLGNEVIVAPEAYGNDAQAVEEHMALFAAVSQVWQNLMGEIQASAVARGLKKPKFNAIAFTASHPPEGERADYLAALASSDGPPRDYGADRYRAAMKEWLPVFLEDQIKLNDFGGSEYIIENLAKDGWTASLWHARGELYRTRGHQRDLVNATQFYENAIALNEGLATAHRGLGLSLFKTGDRTRGQASLARYIELAPDAEDARKIEMMLPQEASQ